MTDEELSLLIQMAKVIETMSLEIKHHRSGQGAGNPGSLENIPPYDALAAQIQAQLLLLEKVGTSASTEVAKQRSTALQEILRLATAIAQ